MKCDSSGPKSIARNIMYDATGQHQAFHCSSTAARLESAVLTYDTDKLRSTQMKCFI